MEEHEMFCFKCGNKAGMAQAGYGPMPCVIQVKEKSTGLSTILSLMWMGLGQLYTGKIGRGLGLMFLHLVMVFIGIGVVFLGAVFGGLGGLMVGGILFLAGWIALWIWNVFDAHKLANEYNDAMRMSGRRPW